MGMTGDGRVRGVVVAVLLCSMGACSTDSSSSSVEPTPRPSPASPSETVVAGDKVDESPGEAVSQSREASVRADVLILRPKGVGPLRLGMSHQEVRATGFASAPMGSRHDGWPRGCGVLQYESPKNDGVDGTVSPTQGLESVVATRRMVTPGGIGLDSTLEEVRRAYPEENARTGDLLTVRASSEAVYRIQVGVSGGVAGIALELMRPDCVR